MIRLLELFGGIGACSAALKRLGIDYEIVDYVEIDKYAVKSYNAMHGLNFQPQDICLWNKNIGVDLIMHGSPCQDFSIAGKQAGGDENSKTRSSLMYETLRIVKKLKPKYIIWENVKNVLSSKHIHNFNSYVEVLDVLGYTSKFQVINSKDHGIPQNRERVFVVSIRRDLNQYFEFPKKQELKLRLKDLLEDNVDESFYLKDQHTPTADQFEFVNDSINENTKDRVHVACNLYNMGIKGFNRDTGEIMFPDGLCKTIQTMQGGNRQPKIMTHNINTIVKVRKFEVDIDRLVKTLRDSKAKCGLTNKELSNQLNVPITKVEHWFRQDQSFAIPDAEIWPDLKKLLQIDTDEFDESIMTFEERPGTYEKSNRVYNQDGISPTITRAEADLKVLTDPNKDKFRIRKLTPRECWRLMDFRDVDFDKAARVNSNSQLYKQAGNSIVVNVLCEILNMLLKDWPKTNQNEEIYYGRCV